MRPVPTPHCIFACGWRAYGRGEPRADRTEPLENVPGRLQDATCNIIVILIYSCLAVVELPAMVFSLLQHNLNSSGN